MVGLAGMVQEQTATQLAGMDQADIYINLQRIWSNIKKMYIEYCLHYIKTCILKSCEQCRKCFCKCGEEFIETIKHLIKGKLLYYIGSFIFLTLLSYSWFQELLLVVQKQIGEWYATGADTSWHYLRSG